MKKALLRKSMVATALLLVLAFSVTAISTPLAQAGWKDAITINPLGDGEGSVSVTKAKSMCKVTFTPEDYPDNHISAIIVDGVFEETFADDGQSYEFKINEPHTLTVYFDPEGTATVPAGTNVPVNLGDGVSLSIELTEGGGFATQDSIDLDAWLVDTSLILWEFSMGVSYSGTLELHLPYSGIQEVTKVYWVPSSGNLESDLDLLYSDVNGDGVVNGDDVSDVANAIKEVSPQHPYNPYFDVDRDGDLDQHDIGTVNEYVGTTLQSLTFEQVGNTLYIWMDHNGLLRAR